jgi:hypothetical protein
MRAAATGSTEPEGLRQLPGVAYHIAKHGKLVTKRHQFVDIVDMVTCTNVCSSAVRICLDNAF